MYALTPNQAIVFMLFVIIALTFKALNKKTPNTPRKTRKWIGAYPKFKEPLRDGYPYYYCKYMKERGMVYRKQRWVPEKLKEGVNDEEVRAEMLKKDIYLSDGGVWQFTGRTRRILEHINHMPY